MVMDQLNAILNHGSNISLVHNSNPGGGRQVQVLATRPLAPGDIIGPSQGLPANAVLDPVEILRCHDVGRTMLSIDGGSEKMAFWMSLAAMAEEGQRRRHHDVGAGEGGKERKKRKLDPCSTHDNTSNSNGGSDSDLATAQIQKRQEEVFDAYLLSLPREGPDPCCWSDDERSRLLEGTPLAKQIDVALQKARGDYDRAAAGVANSSDPNVRGMKLPPFRVRGRGMFPSVLWARSMHQSRSFPRSLVDEEGVWWMGRKKYVPPSSSSEYNGIGGGILASKDVEKAQDDSFDCNTTNTGTIISVRLGGWSAPVITVQKEPPPQPDHSKFSHAKRHGSTLGIMIPLYDMLDHKPGHAVQWEAATHGDNRHCIRFRCVHPIAEGEPIWNNYGPKGNGELLATYGFACRDNVLDSVEGIVLGMRTHAPIPPNKNDDDNAGDATEIDVEGRERVHKARMTLIKEHSIPHRFENDGRVLILGPFSLHRKLPAKPDEDEKTLDERTNASMNSDITQECGEGVIPDDLYRALSFIGMEDVEEGPVVSEDELEMLREVLTKKLDGFGSHTLALDGRARENDGKLSLPGVAAETARSASEQSQRVESVEAYKDGQRELLQLALIELDALMPSDATEGEALPS